VVIIAVGSINAVADAIQELTQGGGNQALCLRVDRPEFGVVALEYGMGVRPAKAEAIYAVCC